MKCLNSFIIVSILFSTLSLAFAQKGRVHTHRYFKEIERPGSVYAVLSNAREGGKLFKLQELDEEGNPVGPVLKALVQHFNGRTPLSILHEKADIIIACNRQLLPPRAQKIHVLPHSENEIYVYMMLGGILIISNNKIPNYDVLLSNTQPKRQICERERCE